MSIPRYFLCALALLIASASAQAFQCDDFNDCLEKSRNRLVDTYKDGGNELFVSGYSWHIPATWTPERRAELNSNAWGLGLGRTVEHPDGDTDTVYFFAFEDSHRNVEWQLGYAYSTYWGSRDGAQLGLGYTAAIVQRPDIANGIPVPVILPTGSVRYGKATVMGIYIPTLNGGVNHGSTLFLFGRYMLQ